MFQLTKEEFENLKSQIAISSSGWSGRRKLPFAFTEHGALQAANALNSSQANKMSIFIILKTDWQYAALPLPAGYAG
jgi:hypothetical protein